MLVQAGLATEADVDAARAACARDGGTVPEKLVLAGAVDDESLTEFFRTRLLVGRIDPNALVGLSSSIIESLDRRLAIELRAIPVHVDDEGNVTVILSDPADDSAVQEIAHRCGIYVVRATATQHQIAWCLGHYFGFLSALGESLLVQPERVAETTPRRRGITNEVKARRKAVLPPVSDDSDQADPAWIVARTEQLRREIAGDHRAIEDDNRTTTKFPALRAEMSALQEGSTRLSTEGEITSVFMPDADADTNTLSPEAGSTKRHVFVDPVEPDEDTALPERLPLASDRHERARPLTDEDLRPLVEELSAEMASAVSASETFDLRETSKHVRPPELAASGVLAKGAPVAAEQVGTESRPILLTKTAPDESGPVVLLERRRTGRDTAVGVGPAGRLSQHPPGATPAPSETAPSGETPASNLSYTGASTPAASEPTNEPRSEPVSSKRKRKRSRNSTAAPSAANETHSSALPISALASEVDAGWGDEDFAIPLPRKPKPTAEVETAAAADQAPETEAKGKGKNGEPARSKRKTAPPTAADADRLTHTVKELSQTEDRNAVFDLLMDYLAGTHDRVAFFAVKKNKVCAWKHKDLAAADDGAEVELASSPTFNTVVESQQPFQGESVDPATREFLTKAIGAAPEDIIAAPVAIGPRVIGVLFGDAPRSTVFDQQILMVTRTAGLALQRILQAAKK